MTIPVDPALLAAGDHNGSTFYQHQRFLAAIRGEGQVEVGLSDGLAAVALGLTAERAARNGTVERLQQAGDPAVLRPGVPA